MTDQRTEAAKGLDRLAILMVVAILSYGGSLFLTLGTGFYDGRLTFLEAVWEAFGVAAQALPLLLAYSMLVQVPLSRLMIRHEVVPLVYMLAQAGIGIYVALPAFAIEYLFFSDEMMPGWRTVYFLVAGFVVLTPAGAVIRWVRFKGFPRRALFLAALLLAAGIAARVVQHIAAA
ncbi:hypothetical protein [Zhihengliuella salsuginis]|uniref:Uncharacterized protein n=1 Tax=Zhihengliuella salsuginis TaxID=578222 RepID=A0ABQ3GLV4_9MICC|nr:hypothetical protein [Zhihengliuella salsuginis]GHD10910.1 hypothetical protein GCM10008096_24950 [Zhihengliuella salsuginis]